MTALRNYADWKNCIVNLCKIPLTDDFVARRLEELRDENDLKTRKFVETWGEAHRLKVIGWFEEAQAELGAVERAR
ncbi:MAG: hypothetical protein AAF318_13940 [Pseudomonadota bacterium]